MHKCTHMQTHAHMYTHARMHTHAHTGAVHNHRLPTEHSFQPFASPPTPPPNHHLVPTTASQTVSPRDCTVPTQYPRARHGGAYVRLGQRSLIPPYAASAPARSPLTSRPSESTSPWRRERRGSDGCRCSRCTQTCPN